MFRKFIREFLLVFISFAVALFVHRLITVEVLSAFLSVPPGLLPVVFIGAIFVQGIFIYLIVRQIVNQKIDRTSANMLWGCYFIVLFVLLFVRQTGISGIELNPLSFVRDAVGDSYALLLSVMNIAFFIPLGYLLKKQKLLFSALFIILLELVVESVQYMFSLGIFDMGDILCNMIGFYIGYLYVSRRGFVTNSTVEQK